MAKDSVSTPEVKPAPKAVVMNPAPARRSRTGLYAALGLAALLAVGGIHLMKGAPASHAANPAPAVAAAAAGQDEVSYKLSDFADGKAKYFKHQTPDGIVVRYFVLKSSDGVVRAAFDACDVCWRANKGYSQDGDFMVCNNCGRRFASVKVNEVKGGCNPAPLARTIQGDRLVIKVQDILEGRAYFNFKQP
ncbi:MAG: DUF2318 domain-containing protein [Desulfarculus sp.]|nr:DUF2318 domain-containing protein [Desulfarculus sp.]